MGGAAPAPAPAGAAGGGAVPLAVPDGRAPGPPSPGRAFARIEDTLSVFDEETPRTQGCRRQRPKLPTARITAAAAVAAHGSHGGVNRLPKTSMAAWRTD